METQLRFVSKIEAHEMIDRFPGKKIKIITYNDKIGISRRGRFIDKKNGKKIINRAAVLILAENKLIKTLNLQGKFLDSFIFYGRRSTSKLILLEKEE